MTLSTYKNNKNEFGNTKQITKINKNNYTYTDNMLIDLKYIKNTKTEYKKQISKLKRLLRTLDTDTYSYLVENNDTNKYIRGSFKSMICNLKNVMGGTYTYKYNNKLYTKSFSSNRLVLWIESMNILLNVCEVVNPSINIYDYNKLVVMIGDNKSNSDMVLTDKIIIKSGDIKNDNVYVKLKEKIIKHYTYDKNYVENKYQLLLIIKE